MTDEQLAEFRNLIDEFRQHSDNHLANAMKNRRLVSLYQVAIEEIDCLRKENEKLTNDLLWERALRD